MICICRILCLVFSMQSPWRTGDGFINGKSKVKAIPLQTWTGPEGSRRLRLLDFKTVDT
jgi:hypothetical protein